MPEIKYDQPIEVTKPQYLTIMTRLSGICAGREVNGRYFIKCWAVEFKECILNILNQ